MALLGDTLYMDDLHAQVMHIVSNASSAQDNGWLGPLDERSVEIPRKGFDFWLQYRMMGALAQYAELAPLAAGKQTVSALLGFAGALDTLLDDFPIVVGDWSHSRMNEVLAPLLWLADNAPSDSDLSAVFSLMGKFQSQGFLWAEWVTSSGFPPDAGALCGSIHYERLPVHGVDIGTGLMQEGHLYRITGDDRHLSKGRCVVRHCLSAVLPLHVGFCLRQCRSLPSACSC
eukprot:SAG22_NODE_754_length_7443_cov_4.952478_2_plen_230_part_00